MSDNRRFRSVSPRERALYLKTLPYADRLQRDDVMMAALQMRERTFAPGEYLLEEGEPIDGMYIITKGEIELRQEGEKVGRLQAPTRVGLLGLLAGKASSEQRSGAPGDIVAVHTVEALELPAELLSHLLEATFDFLLALIRWIAARLSQEAAATAVGSTCGKIDLGDELALYERLRWLHESTLFAGTNLEALLELARNQNVVELDEGEFLWRAGSKVDTVCTLVDGCIELIVESPSGESPAGTEVVREREFLGLIPGLAGDPRGQSARADGPVVYLEMQLNVLLEVLSDHTAMAINLIENLAGLALEQRWRDPSIDELALEFDGRSVSQTRSQRLPGLD